MTEKSKTKNSTSLGGSTLPQDSSEMISSKLKELYNSVCDEGVSDRFLDLLERLDEAENKSGTKGSSK